MTAAIEEFKPSEVICEEIGVLACLENRGLLIESSDKLSPCSHNILSSRSVSLNDIMQ